jgi:O-antigen/teichoic acid export membrane protein
VSDFLQGATMLAGFAISTFFLRYWRDTGDRLFAVFAAAFALFAVSRIALHVMDSAAETRTWVYALRAAAFLAIIVAVVDKNLSSRREDPPHE